MTYDCFTFFNELDLLEIRLNVLKDVVDRFVICEATWTFTGIPKTLLFEANKPRFAEFLDRIVYIVANDPPPMPADFTKRQRAWVRENHQRNELARGLANAHADDTILISDLDEIPDPDMVRKVKGLDGVTRFGMRFYNFYLNFRNYSVLNWPIGTQACSYATFKAEKTYAGFTGDEYALVQFNQGPTLTKLRMAGVARTFKNAGWHFSFLGGEEAIVTKFKAFAHTEQNTARTTSIDEIRKTLETGQNSVICRGYKFFADPIDASYPQYIRDNLDRFTKLIMPTTPEHLRRTRLPRAIAIVMGYGYWLMVRLIPPFLVPFALKVRAFIHKRRLGPASI